MTDKLPSAREVSMDFARCHGCRRIWWVTQNHVRECGNGCRHCGSTVMVDATSIKWYERPELFFWFWWEMNRANDYRWWLNPLDFAKGVWLGLHPEVREYNPRTDPMEQADGV